MIGPEGFVDLRRNPESTTVTVQGHRVEKEAPRKIVVESMPEPPAEKREEVLPARQKTTEGLETSVAEPVKVKRQRGPRGPIEVKYIHASNDPKAYVVVSRNAWHRLNRHEWFSVRAGHFYRKTRNSRGQEEISWLHREIKHCNRSDRFVAFLSGDQRDCTPKNLVICKTKEEARAIKMAALRNSGGNHA